MVTRLTTALLASTVLVGPAFGAVLFDGSTTWLSSGLIDNASLPVSASGGVCHYWFSATQKTKGTIIASYPFFGSNKTSILIEHYPVGGNMVVHLIVQDNENQTSVSSYINSFSGIILDYSGTLQSVIVKWDSHTGQSQYNIGGLTNNPDPTRSYVVNIPFDTFVNFNTWTEGAQYDNNEIPTAFFKGTLGPIQCHQQDNDYQTISTGGIQEGFTVTTPDFPSPRPNPLGIDCSGFFGPVEVTPENEIITAGWPICQDGDATTFLHNNGYPFVSHGNFLTSPVSPWDLWP